eukprot:TRINITY_DN12213_c1_g1_i1.p1 TRINITY_DN12213_c1_g1~~TRINITY_DN12213_c1_g1_i1.p1  ORF type:complete len:752 (-),score=137.71 TRINITY_DN12213_c1_g1_i1:98-2353(-)
MALSLHWRAFLLVAVATRRAIAVQIPPGDEEVLERDDDHDDDDDYPPPKKPPSVEPAESSPSGTLAEIAEAPAPSVSAVATERMASGQAGIHKTLSKHAQLTEALREARRDGANHDSDEFAAGSHGRAQHSVGDGLPGTMRQSGHVPLQASAVQLTGSRGTRVPQHLVHGKSPKTDATANLERRGAALHQQKSYDQPKQSRGHVGHEHLSHERGFFPGVSVGADADAESGRGPTQDTVSASDATVLNSSRHSALLEHRWPGSRRRSRKGPNVMSLNGDITLSSVFSNSTVVHGHSYEELASWAASMGAVGTEQIRVKQFFKGADYEPVRGLTTNTDVEEGEAILAIPGDLVLRADGANATSPVLQSAVAQAVKNASEVMATPISETRVGTALVALRRAVLRPKADEMFHGWRLYFDQLPSLVEYRRTVPLLARRSLLQAFEDLPVIQRLKDQQRRWVRHLNEAKRFGLQPDTVGGLGLNEEWEWAAATVSTRVWSGMGCHILIPIADFVNSGTEDERNVDAYFDIAGRGEVISPSPTAKRFPYVLRARRRISAGEEVLLAYASTSDDRWVQEWGFFPPGNGKRFPLEQLPRSKCSNLVALVGTRLTSVDGSCRPPEDEPQKGIWCAFARLAFEYCAKWPEVVAAQYAATDQAMQLKIAAVRAAVATKSAEAAVARAAFVSTTEASVQLGDLSDRVRLLIFCLICLVLVAGVLRQYDGGIIAWLKMTEKMEKRVVMTTKNISHALHPTKRGR